MYRQFFSGLFLLVTVFSFAQQTQSPDTIMVLDEVWVEASRKDDLSTGHPIHTLDNKTMQRLSSQHLAFVLGRHTGMFIKSYGPSSLATTSLRGGSAGHTALIWNGFSLQNPMNQQNDLALLPVFFIDQISIQHGGTSALWGSGAMGGAIYLNNRPPSETGWQAMAGITAGSMEDIGQHVNVVFAKENYSSSLKVFNRQSQNRYQYINTALSGAPVETQQHAASSGFGLLQENYLRLRNRHHLNIRGWWQKSNRNIPPSLLQSHSGAFQKDQSLRLTADIQSNFRSIVTTYRGGYFRDNLLYRDSVNHESLSRSSTFLQEAEVRWQMSPQMMLYSGANFTHISGSASEYIGTHNQTSVALFGSIAWDAVPENLRAVLSLRQEIIHGMDIPVVPSLGVSWKPLREITLSANAGKNYRIPSLNDRYWVPGGNPELKPESGWSQDFTAAWHPPAQRFLFLPEKSKIEKISVTAFHRHITNWIIWLPGEGGSFWSPENIMEVSSRGLEARTSGSWQQNNLSLHIDLNWDFVISQNTKAKSLNDASVGKQLIYVPKNRTGATAAFSFKDITLAYTHQYTGYRYITSDNTQWLEPYSVGDIALTWAMSMENYQIQFYLSAINIWNQSYFVMASRPMPLRYFEFGINVHINNKN